ncbi:MAG: formate-dependent phosphoribosylglycinamide formyltransferase [Caldisphaeraceae archaeon]|nr:formate-dependent phosphoribosylglycinamide formyltransferase [Caldisphaeraceae archaeon]MEB3797482.1 formate-dependent phosphoribosylglycinamide formyltransferase [Caldisphaeraceae archaeon]
MNRKLEALQTPLGPRSAKVILLGGGELGKELAIEAQRLGFEVVVVDRYHMAPAMHVAHRYYVVDMMDYDALIKIVHREDPRAVIPEIEAINTNALKDLEGEGYNIVPNADSVFISMNRIELRRFASGKLGLPTTRYAFASNEDEIYEACEGVGYPCLIKPEMSSSGHGHIRIMEPKPKRDIINVYRESLRHARGGSNRVIVEEFEELETEFTVIAYRWISDKGVRLGVAEPIEHWRHGQYHYIESWQPSERDPETLKRCKDIGLKVAEGLGGLGIYATELLLTKDGRLLFSEVAPRPHDTGMVTLLSQDISEFSIHIRASTGLPVPEIKVLTPAATYAIYANVENSWYPSLEGIYNAMEVRGVDVRWFGKPLTYRGRRMAVVLARGESVREAREKAGEAAKKLKVVPQR